MSEVLTCPKCGESRWSEFVPMFRVEVQEPDQPRYCIRETEHWHEALTSAQQKACNFIRYGHRALIEIHKYPHTAPTKRTEAEVVRRILTGFKED